MQTDRLLAHLLVSTCSKATLNFSDVINVYSIFLVMCFMILPIRNGIFHGHQIGSVGFCRCLEKPAARATCDFIRSLAAWEPSANSHGHGWNPRLFFHGDDMGMVMVYEWLWNWVYHRTIYFVNLCYTLFGALNIHRPAMFLLCENQGIPGWPRRSCISLTKIGACAHVRCKRYELRSGALWWENDGNHGGQYGLMRFNRDIYA